MANTPLATQSTNVYKRFQVWQNRMERKQEKYEWWMQSLFRQAEQLKQENQEL